MDNTNTNHQPYKGIVLTGTNNITRWKRAIKIHGDVEGTSALWRHTGAARHLEALISAPTRPVRPTAWTRDSKEVYRDDIDIYKFEAEEYSRQQKRERNAKQMFLESVDDHIKAQITDKSARDCWVYLSNTFAVAESMAQSILYGELSAVRLANCSNMQHYLSTITNIKQDLAEHNETLSAPAHKNAILSGLTPGYNRLVEQLHFDAGIGNVTSVADLEKKLYVQEALLTQRKADKPTANRNKDNNTKDNNAKDNVSGNRRDDKTDASDQRDNTGKRGKKPKHPECPKCKKRHPGGEDECWFLHPDKNPYKNGTKIKKEDTVNIAETSDNDTGMCSPSNHAHVNADDAQSSLKQACGGRNGEGVHGSRLSAHGDTSNLLGEVFTCSDKAFAFLASKATQPYKNIQRTNEWCLDSGANRYVVNDRKWFVTNTTCDSSIGTAGHRLGVQGVGTILLPIRTDIGIITVTLDDVLYAPDARCNLLSQDLIAEDAGLSGKWDNRRTEITMPREKATVLFRKSNGLTFIRIADPTLRQTRPGDMVALVDFEHPVWYWHRRLGHLGLHNLRELVKISTGINLTDEQIRQQLKGVCPVCAVTRALVRIPRDPAKRHADEPGRLMHMDTWGPYGLEGFDGTKYFLFITDDATRWTWCARFPKKEDLYRTFKDLHRLIETSENITIRQYRMDGEFSRGPINDFCTRKGIGVEATKPYQHYQNGQAERVNRTIREKAAPMMQEPNITGQITRIITQHGKEIMRETNLPEKLWPEAVEHSVWLKNRSPARALKKREKKTPWAALKNDVPAFGIEKIWGSRAYVSVPPEKRGPKLHAPRGWVGYWVGCESESISKIYSPDEHRVFNIGNARVQDGVGLDDPHDDAALDRREPRPTSADYDNLVDNDSDAEDAVGDDMQSDVDDDNNHAGDVDNEGEIENEVQDNDESRSHSDHPPDEISDDDYDDNNNDDAPDNDEIVRSHFFGGPRANMLGNKPGNDENEDSDSDSDSTLTGGRKGKPYRPDPGKCDPCFRQKRTCVPHPSGKCLPCFKQERRCFPQTKRTKRLIPRKYRTPAIAGPIIPPCRRCYTKAGLCVRSSLDDACAACTKNERLCRNDLEGCTVSSGRLKGYTVINGKPMKEGVEFTPTGHGLELVDPATALKRSTKRLLPKNDPKCTHCKNNKYTCDGGRPCTHCSKKNLMCSFREQNGQLTRKYFKAHDRRRYKYQDHDDDECLGCKKSSHLCDGNTPCFTCVKYSTTRTRATSCTYVRKDGLAETYDTTLWTIKDGVLTLRDGHELGPGYTRRPAPPTRTLLSDELFNRTFNTGFATIPTPSTGLECALFAMMLSYREQAPQYTNREPTIEELRTIARSDDYRSLMQIGDPTNQTNTSYFGADQAGAILWLWGQRHGLNLRLGIHTETTTWLVGTQTDDQQPHTVWIHNDDIEYEYEGTEIEVCNHWEGMRRQKKQSAQPSRFNKKRTHVTDPDTESSDEERPNPLLEKRRRVDDDLAGKRTSRSKAPHDESDTIYMLGDIDEEHCLFHEGTAYLLNDVHEANPVGSKKAVLSELQALYDKAIAEGKNDDPARAKNPREPRTFQEALRDHNAPIWIRGMMEELTSHDENGTWRPAVLPDGRKALTARWVFKLKYDGEGSVNRFKARLVARGFQQKEGIDYEETFSPAVKSDSYRVLFAIAAARGWDVHQYDFKTAFLNGDLLQSLFMKAPDGVPVPKGHVLQLIKTLYGLKQAPRAWYDKLRQALIADGWRVLTSDSCVFAHDSLELYLGVWVDDITLTGPDTKQFACFEQSIGQQFKLQALGPVTYYLGMNVKQDQDSITLSQSKYVKQILMSHKADNITQAHTPGALKALTKNDGIADAGFRTKYQSIVGELIYLANGIRPDIAFAASYLARYASNPNQTHMDAALRVLSYLSSTIDKGVRYERGPLNVHAFSDSDHGGCEDGKSTGCYMIVIAGGLVAWKSKKQSTVAMSTEAAELIAAVEAAKTAVWVKMFINELRIPGVMIEQVPLYIDNNSALALTKNPVFHAKTKHLSLRYHWIREVVNETKDITTHRVSTKDNIADMGTKFLPRDTHEYLLQKMHMVN